MRSPTAVSIARVVRGASGIRAGWLPLPTMRRVRWPLVRARSESGGFLGDLGSANVDGGRVLQQLLLDAVAVPAGEYD